MKEKMYMYYTSDLHSHFDQWSKITGYFNKEKEKRKRANESYWIVDNGDHVDRFHPITEGLMGKGNVQLLNEAGYDVVNLGNNEGITLSHEDLDQLYEDAAFDVVCANLSYKGEGKPEWLSTSTIVESKHGVKVGILGVTAPFETFYGLLGWDIELPYSTLDRELSMLRDQVDVLVLLSHLGINDDEAIAERYPFIDVIIGGHTHHLFQNGEDRNGTLLTAVGKHGTHLGEIMLEWDHDKQSLVRKEAYAVSTEKQPGDLITEEKLKALSEEAHNNLLEPISYLDEAMEVAWFREKPLMKQLVQTLKEWTNADIAMLNAGVLLDNLEAGKVSYSDVHRICPHPMNPCKVELDGDELLEVIRASLSKSFTQIKLKGFGFRGEVIGRMIFAGVEIETYLDKAGEEHVRKVRFNGENIDPDRTYEIATADTFTFGRLLPEVAYSKKKTFYMPELLRDLLVVTLQKNAK
ncbi:bifunctional metallophosphatase/5'-nucleotidase [Thalassobacillus hwangdonensis]|uniref:Bifunctional metallophosphatase/5'-nucleotidase n=1 Tax=Thalassobacillus hwangdonensis TaxID=546108 RepID=A0ABW3L4W7_9BACI